MNNICIHYQDQIIFVVLQEEKEIKAIKNIEHTKVGTYLAVIIQELTLMTKKKAIDAFFINMAPAPIFMQRTILATVNGIACAARMQQKKVDLYGIDGFLGLYDVYSTKNLHKKIVALSNAYANDLFYLFRENNKVKSDVGNMQEIKNLLKKYYKNEIISIVGDITETQKKELEEEYGTQIEYTGIKNIAVEEFIEIAIKKIDRKNNLPYLLPIYTKLHSVEKRI